MLEEASLNANLEGNLEENLENNLEDNADPEQSDPEEAVRNALSHSLTAQSLPALLEAIILAAGRPISEDEILKLFAEEERPHKKELRQALKALQDSCDTRGVTLVEMASGYQFQVKLEWAPIIARLWEEKAPKYSRAFFETLALIAYRQPVTRGEIEEIRGVSLSLSIFKTLLEEREWIRVVGHREVPGRPALYATTKNFLDYFGLKSLEELPSLPEIMNLDTVEFPEVPLEFPKNLNIAVPVEASEIAAEEIAAEETDNALNFAAVPVEASEMASENVDDTLNVDDALIEQ